MGLELQRWIMLSKHLHNHFNTVSAWGRKDRSVLEYILQLGVLPPVSGPRHFEESRAPETETRDIVPDIATTARTDNGADLLGFP